MEAIMARRPEIAMDDLRASPQTFARRPLPGNTSYSGRSSSGSRGAFAAIPSDDENPTAHHPDSQASSVPWVQPRDVKVPERQPAGRPFLHKGMRSLGNSLWLAELSSFTLAFASFAAVVVILATHQDKPQPQWPSLVSLNSLVSIFTSIFKAALIYPIAEGIGELKWIWFAKPRLAGDIDRFDSASRGPWGSLMLLLKRPGNLLASLGALITIAALAIDPFTQQILQYYNCAVPVDGVSSTISRSNNYTASGFHGGADGNNLDAAMAGAIYQGLLNPPANASASISSSCHSGNCTFPEANGVAYSSLAMCSFVEDITNLVSENATQGNYSLPSGLTARLIDTFLASSSKVSNGDSPPAVVPSTPLYAVEMIMLNVNLSVPGIQQSDDLATIPFALRAYLYPCVHTYGDSGISNFILEEQILSTSSLGYVDNVEDLDGIADMRFYYSLAGNYPSLPGTDCTPSQTPQGKDSQATIPLSGSSNLQIIVDPTNPSVVSSDISWYNPGCSYFYGFDALKAQQLFLDSLLDGQTLTTTEGPAYTANGTLWLERLYANGTANVSSASAWMQGLADSMTAIIRQNGDPSNSAPAQGIALGNQTCVQIVWGWLALPAVLLFLTLLFLIGTVLESHACTHPRRGSSTEKGRGPWKSSSLPLLWGGMRDATKARYGGSDSGGGGGGGNLGRLHEMKECADELRVTLTLSKKEEEEEEVDGNPEGGTGSGLHKRRGRWILREEETP